MTRKSPNAESLKLLYVRSGNECAYPDCEHPIFNDKGLYIAQLCHIKAANKGGQRFDEYQTDDERKSIENLLFMCHRHHKETDNQKEFTPQKLTEIKNNHESKFTEKGKEISKQMLLQILFETNYFWKKQKSKSFKIQDLKIERDFNKGVFNLIDELFENIENLKNYCDSCADSDDTEKLNSDLEILLTKAKLDFSKIKNVSYYENPFENRNWELHNIGRPNYFSHISLCLNELRVKISEELLKTNPSNKELKELTEQYRNDFENDFDNSYYVD